MTHLLGDGDTRTLYHALTAIGGTGCDIIPQVANRPRGADRKGLIAKKK
jgi:hypothetical protein